MARVETDERASPPSVRHFGLALAVIAVLALALRVGYVVGLDGLQISDDGFSYFVGAHNVRDGNGFVNPLSGREDARFPPGWTLLLAGWVLLGVDGVLGLQLVASLVGVATVVAVGFAGRQIAGGRVGLVAAAIAALYPGFWTYERELHSETALLGAVAVLFLLAYQLRDRPSLARAMGLGAAVALAALVRSEVILLAALLVTPLILSAPAVPWRRRIGWLAAAGAIAAAVIAPWTLYNASRFEEPVPLSTGLGVAMAQGYCDTTFSGERLGTYQFSCLVSAVPEGVGAGLDASQIEPEARAAAIDYAQDHAGDLPQVVLARQGRTWGLFRPAQQIRFDGDSSNTPAAVGWGAMITYWALVPTAVVGAVILRRRRVLLWPLLSVAVGVAVVTTLVFGQTRYRAAAEVPITLLAGVALVALWDRWQPRASGEARL